MVSISSFRKVKDENLVHARNTSAWEWHRRIRKRRRRELVKKTLSSKCTAQLLHRCRLIGNHMWRRTNRFSLFFKCRKNSTVANNKVPPIHQAKGFGKTRQDKESKERSWAEGCFIIIPGIQTSLHVVVLLFCVLIIKLE